MNFRGILMWLSAGLITCFAQGLPGKNITLKKFVLREYYPNGQLAWIMRGGIATVKDSFVILKNDPKAKQPVRVEYYPQKDKQKDKNDDWGEKVMLFTKKFTYNRERKLGSSDDKVQIRNKKMILNGVGFDLNTEENLIIIRSKVEVTIFRDQANLLGKKKKQN